MLARVQVEAGVGEVRVTKWKGTRPWRDFVAGPCRRQQTG